MGGIPGPDVNDDRCSHELSEVSVTQSYQIIREAAVVRLTGDFDINARDELRTALLDAVRAVPAPAPASPGEVVVDFAEAAFLDSEAMGALIEGLNAGREAGVPLRLINAHGIVHRVLEVSGVLALFNG
jgi:anti-anti-sigma factor